MGSSTEYTESPSVVRDDCFGDLLSDWSECPVCPYSIHLSDYFDEAPSSHTESCNSMFDNYVVAVVSCCWHEDVSIVTS